MLGAEDSLDAQALGSRALHYAQEAGATQETLGVNDRRGQGEAGRRAVAVTAGGAAPGATPTPLPANPPHPTVPTPPPQTALADSSPTR
jgi:hypothetical protein